MIVERATRPDLFSNSYLLVDPASRRAVVIDPGVEPSAMFERVAELEARVEYVLLTHHHHDHVDHTVAWVEASGARVAAHTLEAARLVGGAFEVDELLVDGRELKVGGLVVRCLHTPGHTGGQLAFAVEHDGAQHVFTGDTLFAGSVGSTRAPGHTDVSDLRHSIVERLFALSSETVVWPGHSESTTLAAEALGNPFVRYWRGQVPALNESVLVGQRPAHLLVDARDYDGGRKCLVRWEDGGEDVVPGSLVRRVG